MLSLNATQLAIVAAANKDEVSWLFQIDRTGNDVINDYWSTKVKAWDGDNYTFKIAEFDEIEMNRAQSESGIQAPSSFDFTVSNKDNTLTPSDFSGGNVTLILVISAGGNEAEIRTWNFDIKGVASKYQTLQFHCVDWLQKYLDGDYPNTPLIPYIFPESLQKDKICVPLIFGKPCIPVVPVVKNLITNGYMELDSNWANYGSPTTNERSNTHVYEGDYSRYVVPAASGNTGIKSDTFTTEDGKTYTLDFWVYNPTYGGAANGMVMGKIRKGDDSGWVSYKGQTWKPFVTSWDTWTHFQWHFTEGAATGGAGAYVVFHYIVAQPFYVDQVFVGKSKYLLGAKIADPTDYVVDELYTPRDWDGDHQIWSKDNFTFEYTHEEGADGNDYAFCECIAADQDGDGTLDSNITFKKGQRYLPAGAWYTRSDTIDKTSPADILDYILQDWGIPSARIDATTLAAVKTAYSGWGLTWNMGLWTYEEKKKLLARLLLMCHTELIVRDKIYFKVHVKASQKTLTKADVLKTADVGEGTFKYDVIESEDTKDSGYVTFQKEKGCLDNLLAVLTTAKGSTNYIADDEISADYIQDSQDAQRVGTLALQRLFLSEAKITCDTKGTCLALECDDVITLNHADYGGSYAVLIDSFRINRDASIGIEATKFSQALDDWGDLSPVAINITQMPDLNSYGTVISGPDCLAGQYIGNVLPGRLRIGMTGNYILFDPVEPIQTFVEGGVTRMKIGDLGTDDWGIEFLDHSGNSIFKLDGSGVNTLCGWSATVNKFTCQSGEVGMNAEETGGVDWRFWAGHATPGSAPFRVDESGNLYCTLIYASGGTIGGWTIGATKLSITGIELDQANNRIRAYTGANYVDMTAAGLTGYDSVLGTTFKLPTNGDAPEFSSGIIKECIYEIYTSGIIRTDADVANNGGLIINNTELKGYTSAGLKVLQFIYDGTDQGDAYIGDFDNSNPGLKYDHSVGSLKVKALVEIIGNPALQNMLMNGGFEETDGTNAYYWKTGAGISTEVAGGDDSNNWLEITRAGANNPSNYCNPDSSIRYFEVNEGEVYEYGGSCKSDGTCRYMIALTAYDKDKANGVDDAEINDLNAAWTSESGIYTIPAGKKFISLWVQAHTANGWAAFDNVYLKRVDEKAWSFTHASDRTKIDGGTIYTNTIVASAINGAGFGTLTITSGKIAINTADALEIQAAGNIKVLAGGDIHMIGDDSDPATIYFDGSSYDVVIGFNTAGTEFGINPTTDDEVDLKVGWSFLGTDKFWENIYLKAKKTATMQAEYAAGNYAFVRTTVSTDTESCIDFYVRGQGLPYSIKFIEDASELSFRPTTNKAIDLGIDGTAWDDCYADDYNNEADFFCLDTYNDLQTILNIQPSGKIDERTGLPLIDDDTLPDWMLVKDKRDIKKIVYSADGKPWISNRVMFSLLMGAIKELNQKIEDLS